MAKSVEEYEKIDELRTRIEGLETENADLLDKNQELERLVRNSILPGDELAPELLAQGDDLIEITCFYSGKDKKRKVGRVQFTWDEIFQVIGPPMFGFLLAKNQYTHKFEFENGLEELVRTKIADDVEGRKIDIMSSIVETIILQFKQLGYIVLETNEKNFTGWTLTVKGESRLTRLKTVRSGKPRKKKQ